LLATVAVSFTASTAGAQEPESDTAASGATLEVDVANVAESVDDSDAKPVPETGNGGAPRPAESDDRAPATGEPQLGEPAIVDEAEETPEEKLQRYFALYKDAMDNEAYQEADVLAKQVVELTIGLFGVDSLDSARALTNLGIAQHQNGDYEAAIANYEAAIDIIERVEDRLNGNLVNPLKGLGAAELASGRPDLAAETFERAIHVTHVNEGPHNLDQVEVLESLAETYLAGGNFDEVEKITEIIFGLEARGIPLDSLEILPVLEKQANWQHRLQLFEKERYTWRKIIDIIEDKASDDDLRLIAPLTGLGKSYLYVGDVDAAFHHPSSITSGEVYLKRAVRISEDNPAATWKMQEDTLLSLGDFYILSGQPSRARKVYRDVWDLLSADEQRLASRHDHLEAPVVLQEIHPPRYVGIDGEVRTALPGDDYEQGQLVYDYSVSTRGYTTDITLVKAEPGAFADMQRTVERELRSLIYRPRLANGEAVDTQHLTYTHTFFYRQSDLTDATAQGDVAPASD
jgi:tetratricopeptide (TPR) repeat protein